MISSYLDQDIKCYTMENYVLVVAPVREIRRDGILLQLPWRYEGNIPNR